MRRPRVLELFSGIGGVAAALGEAAEVVAAIDVDRRALAVYAANHPGRTVARTLDSIRPADLAALEADLWTMSPPCQPFTRRGHGRDLDDPRTRGFLAVLAAVAAVRPPWLFVENVPGFAGSRAHARLVETLAEGGYRRHERLLCPSELGMPNRRRRWYLVAGRQDVGLDEPAVEAATRRRPLAGFLDPDPAPDLAVPADLVRRYRHAVDVVSADDPGAVTACFTSAYGRSPVRSGSYLAVGDGGGTAETERALDEGGATERLPSLRRFSPAEILRLLGFPASFRLPADLPRSAAWHLAGNSLSLPPVRAMLSAILPLPPSRGPVPVRNRRRPAPR
ncbi:MAG TPA: DNA cytosine methyltransferase [Thermoanaerobaculia bacterium]|nr:DNA cytosine methyltransferase [Thermoanaerobaculia bacterium]